MKPTGIVWDPAYLEHVTDEGHPDHPRRLEMLYRKLEETAGNGHFVTLAPPEATDEQILLVHRPSYLERVRATATQGASSLSTDTLTCERSWHTARLAVGAGTPRPRSAPAIAAASAASLISSRS